MARNNNNNKKPQKSPSQVYQEQTEQDASIRLKHFILDIKHDPMFNHRTFYPVLYKEVIKKRNLTNVNKDPKKTAETFNIETIYEYYLLKGEEYCVNGDIMIAILLANGPMVPERERIIFGNERNGLNNHSNYETALKRTLTWIDLLNDNNMFNFVFESFIGQHGNFETMRKRFLDLSNRKNVGKGQDIHRLNINDKELTPIKALGTHLKNVNEKDVRAVLDFMVYMGNTRNIVTDFNYRPMSMDQLENYLSYNTSQENSEMLSRIQSIEIAIDNKMFDQILASQLEYFTSELYGYYRRICVSQCCASTPQHLRSTVEELLKNKLSKTLTLVHNYTRNYISKAIIQCSGNPTQCERESLNFAQNYVANLTKLDQNELESYRFIDINDFANGIREDDLARTLKQAFKNDVMYINEICCKQYVSHSDISSNLRNPNIGARYDHYLSRVALNTEEFGKFGEGYRQHQETYSTSNITTMASNAAEVFIKKMDIGNRINETSKLVSEYESRLRDDIKIIRDKFKKYSDKIINYFKDQSMTRVVASHGLSEYENYINNLESLISTTTANIPSDLSGLMSTGTPTGWAARVPALIDPNFSISRRDWFGEIDRSFSSIPRTLTMHPSISEYGISNLRDIIGESEYEKFLCDFMNYKLALIINRLLRSDAIGSTASIAANIANIVNNAINSGMPNYRAPEIIVEVAHNLAYTLSIATNYINDYKLEMISDDPRNPMRQTIRDKCNNLLSTTFKMIDNSYKKYNGKFITINEVFDKRMQERVCLTEVEIEIEANRLLAYYFERYLKPVLIDFTGVVVNNFEFESMVSLEDSVVSRDKLHFGTLLGASSAGILTFEGAVYNDLAKYTYILMSDKYSGLTFNDIDSVTEFLNEVYNIRFFNNIIYGKQDAYVYLRPIGVAQLYRGAQSKIRIEQLKRNYEYLTGDQLFRNIRLPKPKKH